MKIEISKKKGEAISAIELMWMIRKSFPDNLIENVEVGERFGVPLLQQQAKNDFQVEVIFHIDSENKTS